jgi:hypothetical protein
MIGKEHALQYFTINEVTGEVYIKKPLVDDSKDVNTYEVNLSSNHLLIKTSKN